MPSTKTDPLLLDANVLIALTVRDHEHHRAATEGPQVAAMLNATATARSCDPEPIPANAVA